MANHGSKFVSVNLNKSYGQQHHPSHHSRYPHFNGSSAAGRDRAGTGAPGGMLVLSRARGAAPKIAPKLSVPPPLNLPSLRKEHEKFDMSGVGGPGAGAGAGSGSRPNSSGMGWTKPAAAASTALPEKTEIRADTAGLDGASATAGASRGFGSYMPPSARFSGAGVVGSVSDIVSSVDKAVLLRGEDFPSLQAARPVSSGTPQKQKDGLTQKQKHVVRDEVAQDKESNHQLDPPRDMSPTSRYSNHTTGTQFVENGGKGYGIRKQEGYFTDPLPLVSLNPRSDWADDERDTGHGFADQGRDITGYSNSESYWDRDFDLPRPSLPHKPAPSQYGRWGERDNETGKKISSEVLKVDLYSKDARASSSEGKEVNKWRNSPLSKDGFSYQETGNYRSDVGSRIAVHNTNMAKENKYAPPHYMDIGHNRDSAFGRRDLGFVGQQQRNNSEYRRQVTEQPYRYRADNFQSNNNLSKSSFASGGKMHHVADPIMTMGRDKRFSNTDRDYGTTGFDENDIFSEGLIGVIKRKKDAARSTDFHDPVRESFEAELERVQKMQELERQRATEEQEWALEQARREEDERHKRIREEEERLRKLEEEARETAWRAEQERVETIQKAEEQRIMREEEKKRMQLEEERRKLAAKQKLEELEARMAMRKAETLKMTVDELPEVEVKGKLDQGSLDLDTWEDSERMVENVMNSGSFDSSSHSIPVEMSSRSYPPREGSLNSADRGKANDNNNSWKRDLLLEKGGSLSTPPLSDPEAGHYSPRRDAFGGGRANPRKELYGEAGYLPSRAYLNTTMQDPYSDEFGYHKDQRWNSGNVGDSYEKIREMDSEFHNGNADRYVGDNTGWGQGHPRVNDHPPYPEQLYPHSEANDLCNNFGRSRYSMKQPRVFPPPSLLPSQRPNYARVTEHAGASSTFLDNSVHYTHAERTESLTYSGSSSQRGLLEPSAIFRHQQENNIVDNNLNEGSRCASQSSLSVSSPPTSPPHLSHDELDESTDVQVTSYVAAHNVNSGLMVQDNISGVEDEEWTVENDDTMQQQEEYDEDEDGYIEEDEVRERGDENLELSQNFEGLELEEAESPHTMDNVVLGFDEGVEVVLPNDDCGKKVDIPESSIGIVEERGTVDGFPLDENFVTNADDKFGLQGCISQHVADSSDSTVLAGQQITQSTAVTSQACNNVPSLSSSGGQADLPVKLQFGLFSGQSLIPSPVPAIQIGSIQMPLHIHPPVGQAMTHMHPSQPPIFQFGQLRYTSSIAQGIVPMGPQSMSFLHQPNIVGHFNINQTGSGSVTHEPSRENVIELPSLPKNNNQLRFVSRENPTEDDTILKADGNEDSTSNDNTKTPSDDRTKPKNYLPSSKSKAPESQSQSVGEDRNYSGPRGLGPLSGRGRRFAYAVKSTNTRVINVQDHDMQVDPNGFKRRSRRTVQQTEFRVRENYDRKPARVFFNNSGSDDNRSNYTGKAVGVFMRSGSKRDTISNRTMRPRIESEPSVSGNVASQEVSGDKAAKDLSIKSRSNSRPGEASFRRNASEEDVDALQSGVVRVFKQPGIEAPGDEDDFIEVRSKRQMLNDRREQREKEIMAKSRTAAKPPRKPRASRQKDVVSRSYNKLSALLAGGEMKSSQLDSASKSPRFSNNEISTGCTIASSQPPIGTPPINSDAQAIIMSTQAGSVSVVSNGVKECEPGVMLDSKNKVMSLSQSQIDEAMKPAGLDSSIPAVGGHSNTVSEPILPTPSILTKDKTFTSGTSPINSLLAGEKIQFGAVTSPTVLPSSSHVVSHGIGAPGSNRPDPQMARSFPEKEGSLFFSKEKHLNTDHVQDCEAEAEAAVSAVVVSAISSDETVRNGLGSVNDTTCFSATGTKGRTTGVVGLQHLASRSQSEELLSVSLPADLSVETTPISMWLPLPSPQGSSSQMLSHFPAGPSSHFPFYEMNPLLGGPIFAFSPHEESSGPQSQPQKSTAPASGALGNWPQCHSGVDSFYGAPAGFPGPYIGPPEGIQGPPHMVVYNHFAPVGQYGQVGLSFMGTTYIPSGKQADWKNNAPASSAMHNGEGDINKLNMSNVQRSGSSVTGPIQHLAPGSSLLPMPPPLPMFDASPFQTASGLPHQARWGQFPASQLHPVPVSRPLQPKIEGAPTSQVNHGNPIEQSLTANRFVESRAPSQSNNNNNNIPSFTYSTDVAPFSSCQLGLVDSSVAVQTSTGSMNALESSKIDTGNNSKTGNASSLKTPFPKKNVSTQHGINNSNNAGGYGYQRGGPMTHSRTNSSGHEYSHRRIGYHGRNQSGGVDKGFHPPKVKQIYVAKQATSGGPAT